MIQTSGVYLMLYFMIYFSLMFNDGIKYFFFPKALDIPINVLSFFLTFLFAIDIIVRCIVEKGYIFRFYFFTDVASIFFIISSAIVIDIG